MSLEVPSVIFPFPLRILKILALIFGKKNQFSSITESFEIDSSESYRILKWDPPFNIYESFKIFAEILTKSEKDYQESKRD